jgi:glycine/D-amino acid oxidase-like deaminating enzyme
LSTTRQLRRLARLVPAEAASAPPAAGGPPVPSARFAAQLDSGREEYFDWVVLATGSWAVAAEDYLPGLRVPMEGIASSSLLLHAPRGARVAATAAFCDEDPQSGTSLELYPRANDTVYVCGFGESPRLRKEALLSIGRDEVPFNSARVANVLDGLRNVLAEPLKAAVGGADMGRSACLRPCTDDAKPMLGRVPGTNLIIATGGDCWGITWRRAQSSSAQARAPASTSRRSTRCASAARKRSGRRPSEPARCSSLAAPQPAAPVVRCSVQGAFSDLLIQALGGRRS